MRKSLIVFLPVFSFDSWSKISCSAASRELKEKFFWKQNCLRVTQLNKDFTGKETFHWFQSKRTLLSTTWGVISVQAFVKFPQTDDGVFWPNSNHVSVASNIRGIWAYSLFWEQPVKTTWSNHRWKVWLLLFHDSSDQDGCEANWSEDDECPQRPPDARGVSQGGVDADWPLRMVSEPGEKGSIFSPMIIRGLKLSKLQTWPLKNSFFFGFKKV